MPKVTVLPRRRLSGWQDGSLERPLDSKGRDAEFFAHIELNEALTTQYEGFAHIQPFSIEGTDEDALPRMNLPAFDILRSAGFVPVKSCIFIDLDRDVKAPWDDLDEASDVLEDLVQAYPRAYCVYMTPKGARLVFTLTRPIPVEDCELWQNGLHDTLVDRVPQGLFIDVTSSERNRVFAAPHVVRDGEPTYHLPMEFPETHEPLPVDEIVPVARVNRLPSQAPDPPTETIPPDDPRWAAAGLEYVADWEIIPDDEDDRPGRDVQLTQMVGTAAKMLEDDPGAHFEIWALLGPLVQRTERAGSSLGLEALWRKIVRFVTMEKENPELPSGKRIFRPSGDLATDAERMLPIILDKQSDLFRNDAGEVVEFLDGALRAVNLPRWKLLCSRALAIPKKGGFRPIPANLCEVSKEEAAETLPLVRSVVSMPPVNSHGAPRQAPGLGKDGQLYTPAIRRMPPMPSPEKAIELWRDLLSGYLTYRPNSGFSEEIDLYRYLAWLCGCVVRQHLTALPVLVIDANMPGAGKTLLLDIAAIVFEGGRSGGRPPDTDYKWDVDLLTWARAGKRFVWYDNVSGRFGSDSLNRILTGGKIAGRNLHSLDHTGDFDFKACIALTANNVEIHYDTKRRSMLVSLHREYDFKVPRSFSADDKRAEARAKRGQLFMALVSLLHEYKAAGMPRHRRARALWASFEDFDRWAVGAVWHFGGHDPLRGMAEKVDATDPTLESLGRLLERLGKAGQFQGAFSASDVKAYAAPRVEVIEDICSLLDVPVFSAVSTNALARALKAGAGVRCNGHVLIHHKRGRHSCFTILRKD